MNVGQISFSAGRTPTLSYEESLAYFKQVAEGACQRMASRAQRLPKVQRPAEAAATNARMQQRVGDSFKRATPVPTKIVFPQESHEARIRRLFAEASKIGDEDSAKELQRDFPEYQLGEK